MPSFKKINALPGSEWTGWVSPKGIYKMACCDCGLVHDLEFKVAEILSQKKNGWWEGRDAEPGKFKTLFRVRRNDKATDSLRKTTVND